MAYDLLIRNGRVIDGSGTHAFRGDVGTRKGKIAETGKLPGRKGELPSPKGEGFKLRLKPVIVDLPVDCSQSQNRAQCLKLIFEATKVKPYRLKAGGLRIPKGDSKVTLQANLESGLR